MTNKYFSSNGNIDRILTVQYSSKSLVTFLTINPCILSSGNIESIFIYPEESSMAAHQNSKVKYDEENVSVKPFNFFFLCNLVEYHRCICLFELTTSLCLFGQIKTNCPKKNRLRYKCTMHTCILSHAHAQIFTDIGWCERLSVASSAKDSKHDCTLI